MCVAINRTPVPKTKFFCDSLRPRPPEILLNRSRVRLLRLYVNTVRSATVQLVVNDGNDETARRCRNQLINVVVAKLQLMHAKNQRLTGLFLRGFSEPERIGVNLFKLGDVRYRLQHSALLLGSGELLRSSTDHKPARETCLGSRSAAGAGDPQWRRVRG